jgi:hypothetical protein
MPNPKFSALEVVLIGARPELLADRSAGQEGIVFRVRGYDDGHVAYEIGTLDADVSDSTVPGIYRENDLVSTGRSVAFDDVADLVEKPSPVGQRSQLLDAEGRVVPGRGYVVLDDISAHA